MLTERLSRYFSLGFEAKPSPNDPPLMLGRKRPAPRQNLLWEISCWLLVTAGIFLRKAIFIADLGWARANLSLGALLASAVIGFAVFPPFMQWFNHRRPGSGLAHYASAFTFGFFVDLANLAAVKIGLHLRG